MKERTLGDAARAMGGTLHGADAPWDVVSTDTRNIGRGDLFFALEGPRFDGHDFVAAARECRAAGAVVCRVQPVELAQIEVADTRRALGRLAADWRAGFDGPLIALTGSNGKTTVKEMIRSILAKGGETLATEGNLNNEIGVPLTLLRLAPGQRWAVVELGANHAGEIAYLTTLCTPDVALVTNAGPAHLEGFGSLEGVARAKGEIFAGLGERATAVINADDTFAALWEKLAGERRTVLFGLDPRADFRAEGIRESASTDGVEISFELRSPAGAVPVRLAMSGRHNVRNALGAAAAAMAAGATLEQVRDGLAAARNVAGRLRRLGAFNGATLFDDCYNANPASVQAAIDFLAAQPGERWLVLGDMGELGERAAEWHEHCGRAARDAGLEHLLCIGSLSREAARAFGEGAESLADVNAAAERLRPQLRPGVNVLCKASRSAGLERLVALLAASETPR